MSGTLYVVATPIGNLEDITLRALRVLQEVACIACEDTRHSRGLLAHFKIATPTVSYYRENEARRGEELLARLRDGDSVALISDAGWPAWADPGARLVRAAAAAGIPVAPIPGAGAAAAAWMASGFEETTLTLAGFPPARSGQRRQMLTGLRDVPGALVFFEAPHRLAASLADMAACLGADRQAVLGREMTKHFEEFRRGTLAELAAGAAGQAARGECTIVVGGPVEGAAPPPPDELETRLRAAAAMAPAEARRELRELARATGLDRSELYRRMQQVPR